MTTALETALSLRISVDKHLEDWTHLHAFRERLQDKITKAFQDIENLIPILSPTEKEKLFATGIPEAMPDEDLDLIPLYSEGLFGYWVNHWKLNSYIYIKPSDAARYNTFYHTFFRVFIESNDDGSIEVFPTCGFVGSRCMLYPVSITEVATSWGYFDEHNDDEPVVREIFYSDGRVELVEED